MKNTLNKTTIAVFFVTALVILGMFSCTKYEKGFLSPYVQYSISTFQLIRGRTASSNSLVSDGSSIPLHIKWIHIYDSAGKIVDTLFNKTYPVAVWTAAYNSTTDLTFATISAKRSIIQLQPIVVNETSGTLDANSGTINLPIGTYAMDLEVSNVVGSETLKKAMTIIIQDGKPFETAPETGNYSVSRLVANTAGGPSNSTISAFNNINNPFVLETLTRYADTPNVVIVTVTDKNGVVFNPKSGEIAKRPNSGLNPTPPFLQNLQDYAPDTFQALDTAMYLKYPLVPFPIASLGNGYNMYYRLPTAFVHIDSTTAWSTNTAGFYYKSGTDSHYKGVLKDDLYDYSLRIPMRIQVPGAYKLNLRLLNTTHR